MRLLIVSLLCLFIHALPCPAGDPTPQELEFFEKKIRPVFLQHCAKCHSEEAEKNKKLKGGLLVDTKDGLLKGGDTGPALVPHKPKESLLLKVLQYTGDSNMPPAGKLPEAVIKDVETWIAMGAPDPRNGKAVRRQVGMSLEEGRKFWSYVPVKTSTIPQNNGNTNIDKFIVAELTKRGLKPNERADKPTLLRRLYIDLIGLPPTPEQVDAFVKDADPQAFEKTVDKLLASPEYAERWARHWLDVARYAESITLRGTIYKDAWRYRDYVIESFDKDVPFNQFIQEQLAGDLLPATSPEQKRRHIVATSFLVMGNTNLEEQDKKALRMDFVDETLDVVTKGFLGQTVTCARCHDHKFDPIPTKDYYALAGIFRNTKTMEHANVSNWVSVPLPVEPEQEKVLKAHEAKVLALQTKIKNAKSVASGKPAAKGAVAIKDIAGIVVDDAVAKKVGTWKDSKFSEQYIGDGYTHDDNTGKGEKTITFTPELPANGKYEVRFAYNAGKSRANNVPVTVFSADGEKEIVVDMTKTPPIEGRYLSLGEYKFERKGQSFVIVSNEGTKGHVTPDAVVFIPVGMKEANQAKDSAKSKETDDVKALESELKELQAKGPVRPMAMSLVEEKEIEDCKVHIRGLVSNQGEMVPRGVLQVAMVGPAPKFPRNQSGRKELAEWIASSQNPLTARVYANRVWHWLLGSGIVRTTDNFGTTGEKPSHPELLDYLAGELVREGWSTKKLIRQIVLSQTYQQSSVAEAATVKADPENTLFSRASKKRMDAEVIRDTMLQISGSLTQGGKGGPTYPANIVADYNYQANTTQRSIYLPVFRNSLPDIFEVFDFADPSTVNGKRNASTVAPQALYFLNNPFPIQQAKLTAEKLLAIKDVTDEARVVHAYRLILGRMPTESETSVGVRFIQTRKTDKDAWAALVQALFASADFRTVK